MSDEEVPKDADVDPIDATTQADVSDGREQKQAPIDPKDAPTT